MGTPRLLQCSEKSSWHRSRGPFATAYSSRQGFRHIRDRKVVVNRDVRPNPRQRGHAPTGLLKLNSERRWLSTQTSHPHSEADWKKALKMITAAPERKIIQSAHGKLAFSANVCLLKLPRDEHGSQKQQREHDLG